ncbi:hypothetical protein AF335_19400 [Streptomyces eurocidicus]|uniref:Uncharacterized protein n=1 Tax=Streptomyces eurocidicus TaxID=66423 RepID=A0A2N8NT58_STREU|nr:hypothetical protein [Streptomyces eurocidicus]MBB5119227.1 hypothetical protein [Streptomyces eurocidicus]MBF6053185.1 hypothetical protein [Streptomyces eurocidicus]PNE31958.1 hypothetical protein AF335_19400 [Streptomyces eurocidicus]
MPEWGRALSQSVSRGAAAVLIALLLLAPGGEAATAASGSEREPGSVSLEFTPADEYASETDVSVACAIREGRRPGRRGGGSVLPPAGLQPGPGAAPSAPRATGAPPSGTPAHHTVLRC